MNCVPIDMLPTPCPLLPTPWAGEICCSLLHFGTFIHGLRCATSSSTDECDIIYLWYKQFAFTSRTLICTLNGIRLLQTGIMAEYTVVSTSQGTYVQIEQTTVIVCDKSNIWNVQRGEVRGMELRTADLHTACLQVVLTRLFIKARCRLLK